MLLEQGDACRLRLQMCRDLFRSRQVADSAASLLRDRGVETFNGVEVSGESLSEHVTIETPGGPAIQVATLSSDVERTASVVNAVYDAYESVVKRERQSIENLFLERLLEMEADEPERKLNILAAQAGAGGLFIRDQGKSTLRVWSFSP